MSTSVDAEYYTAAQPRVLMQYVSFATVACISSHQLMCTGSLSSTGSFIIRIIILALILLNNISVSAYSVNSQILQQRPSAAEYVVEEHSL